MDYSSSNQSEAVSDIVQRSNFSLSTIINIMIPVFISILIIGSIVGIILYFILQIQLSKIKKEFQQQISQLTEIISQKEAQREELEKRNCKGIWKDGICIRLTCLDSDANEKPNDIFIKGYVTFTNQNGTESTLNDECAQSGFQVNEMYCNVYPDGSGNAYPAKQTYDCPAGCSDGACIKR